jgi:antitoxin VapB
MPSSNRDPRTDRLAREVAARTDDTITEATGTKVRERLDREEARHQGLQRLLAIGELCASHMQRPACSADHGARFYDDAGLPAS